MALLPYRRKENDHPSSSSVHHPPLARRRHHPGQDAEQDSGLADPLWYIAALCLSGIVTVRARCRCGLALLLLFVVLSLCLSGSLFLPLICNVVHFAACGEDTNKHLDGELMES